MTKQDETKQSVVKPTTVTLSHEDQAATIFYTTDGTYPVPNRAKHYTKPFIVNQRTLVKAVAVVNEDVSPVFAKEYGI